MSRLSRRAVAALSTGVCVVVAGLAFTGIVLAGPASEVGSLDGHTVTRDELLFHMRRLAPTVQNELRNEYHLPATGAIDWATPVGDGTALERLTSRALDEIWRDKATLVLAEEHGLSIPIDHEEFLTQVAEENARRADAIASGETVYGVAEFAAEEYYSHRLTEVTTALKRRLSATVDDPLWVDDAEIPRAFEADRDSWSANATTYRYSKLVVELPDDASPNDTEGLQRRVAAARRLADVDPPGPGATLTTGTYDGGSAGMNSHDQDLTAVLGNLAQGEISAPIVGTGQVTYYELDDIAVDEEAALAAYSQRIQQSLVEEKFRQFLQRRVGSSTIEVDTAAVEAINAEDVRQ
ncbi:MAG: hypothetical protein ACRDP8_11730 [Actinopolymorphaceae bacterium]